MNMDKFDLNILSLLDIDARQSHSDIGKTIGRSKQFVNYRINNLMKQGIINGYNLDVDLRKSGYHIFNIFLQLQNISPKDTRRVLNYLNHSTHVGYCLNLLGNWELFISVQAREVEDFYKFLGNFHKFFGKFIKKEKINLEINGSYTNKRFILEKNTRSYIFKSTISPKKKILSTLEKRIILELKKDPLVSILTLSSKINLSPNKTKNMINNLKKEGIIKRVNAQISTEKLGFERYLFLIELGQSRTHLTRNLLNYLQDQINIDYIIECIGSWDIICSVYVRDIDELIEIINRFKRECKTISSIEFLRVINPEKEGFMLN